MRGLVDLSLPAGVHQPIAVLYNCFKLSILVSTRSMLTCIYKSGVNCSILAARIDQNWEFMNPVQKNPDIIIIVMEGKEGREGMEGGNCYQFSFQLIRCWLLFIIVEWIVLFSSCALIRIANTDIIIIVNKGRKVRKDGKVRKGREWRERLRAFDVKAAYTKGNAVYFEVKSVLYCMSRKKWPSRKNILIYLHQNIGFLSITIF